MEIRYKGIWYKDLAVIPYFLIPYTIVLYKLKGLLNKYRDCFVPRNDAPNLRHCEGRIDRSNL